VSWATLVGAKRILFMVAVFALFTVFLASCGGGGGGGGTTKAATTPKSETIQKTITNPSGAVTKAQTKLQEKTSQ
jgi:hypothetical protein